MNTEENHRRERDSAIEAILPVVPQLGWSHAALRKVAGRNSDLLFPGGGAEMVDAYIDLADRRMIEGAAAILPELSQSKRVRALILERLSQATPHKEAVRRAFAVLALPGNATIAARGAARTVDRIWHQAGDVSADFSWYTKRAILAGVYGSTLLYWMRDGTDEASVTEFLDRRLAGVARLGKLRARLSGSPAPSAQPHTYHDVAIPH